MVSGVNGVAGQHVQLAVKIENIKVGSESADENAINHFHLMEVMIVLSGIILICLALIKLTNVQKTCIIEKYG